MDREQYCFLLLTAAAGGHLCNSRDEAALLNKLSGRVPAVLAALPHLTSLFLRDDRLGGFPGIQVPALSTNQLDRC